MLAPGSTLPGRTLDFCISQTRPSSNAFVKPHSSDLTNYRSAAKPQERTTHVLAAPANTSTSVSLGKLSHAGVPASTPSAGTVARLTHTSTAGHLDPLRRLGCNSVV